MVKKSPAPKSKDRVKLVKPENTDSGAALKVKKTRVKTPAMIANPGGQPCKLDECGAKIIEYIRAGNTYENACGCARISYFTFNSWMKRGKEELEKGEIDSKYVKFLQDVRQAETDCEDEIVRHWLKAIPNNWQAGKEYLARKNPDKWGSKEKMDVTSNGESIGKPIFLPLKGDE